MSTHTLHHGDCLEVLRTMPDNSVDSVVTDPPYGLSNTSPEKVADAIVQWATGNREFVPDTKAGFMGAEWDAFVPPPAVWDECLRVLKPGGHLLAFAGTRTQDLMGISIRMAGFDIRENIAWMHGQGFPKSHNISKAIDKAAGAEREVVGVNPRAAQQTPKADETSYGKFAGTSPDLTADATDEAKKWSGWGTALKPAFEPVIVARKPFKGTVAANVVEHGTGALNIDACRIGSTVETWPATRARPKNNRDQHFDYTGAGTETVSTGEAPAGRFPANVVLDRSQADALDEQTGTMKDGVAVNRNRDSTSTMPGYDGGFKNDSEDRGYGGEGGGSRFFYVAKAPMRERPVVDGVAHPTVKPVSLMEWLVKLVTPEGGTVLDPFAGSGTTGEAAIINGYHPILIEAHAPYIPLIKARVNRTGGTK